MTHKAGHLGVTHYNPFAQDPDYPKATTAVSNATEITNPGANTFTSQFPSAPTTVPGMMSTAGAKSQGMYEAGAGPNDTLSKLWWNINPKDTPLGGVDGPKPPVINFGNSGTGASASDALALAKFNYEKQQNALKLAGLQNYADSGSYNAGFNNLLKMITDQGGVSKTGITDAYGRATTNINQGYDAAQGLGDSGYRALNTYLGANPNNPYAGMEATVGSAPDALTQYLSSYGVSDQPVRGQIQADQLQAQQGAGNYQNLIDILSSVAQSGAASRGAESAMGQNLFNTSLGQDKAGYQGQASNAQAQALAALQQQMFQSQFGVENDRNSLANQLAQILAAAGGKPPVTTPPVTTNTKDTTGTTRREVDDGYASKAAAYNRPAQTNEEIAALRAVQEAARLNEIRQAVSGRRGNNY